MKPFPPSRRVIRDSAVLLLCFAAVALLCTCSSSESGGGDDGTAPGAGFGAALNECAVTPGHYRYDINFDPAMLAVVDRHAGTGNLLVRGSMPIHTVLDGTQIDFEKRKLTYDELNRTIGAKIPGFDLAHYQLIDVSMIDDQYAGLDTLIPEVKSFGLTVCDFNENGGNAACWPPNPNCSASWEWGKLWGSGRVETQPDPKPESYLVWWPISACDGAGDVNHPSCSIPVDQLLHKSGWNFSGLVDFLAEQMKRAGEGGKKKLLYIHCSWGKDRTGSLAAAYLLKKAKEENDRQVTLNRAIQEGKDAVNVIPNDGYLRLTVVYCKEIFPGEADRCRYGAP